MSNTRLIAALLLLCVPYCLDFLGRYGLRGFSRPVIARLKTERLRVYRASEGERAQSVILWLVALLVEVGSLFGSFACAERHDYTGGFWSAMFLSVAVLNFRNVLTGPLWFKKAGRAAPSRQ